MPRKLQSSHGLVDGLKLNKKCRSSQISVMEAGTLNRLPRFQFLSLVKRGPPSPATSFILSQLCYRYLKSHQVYIQPYL